MSTKGATSQQLLTDGAQLMVDLLDRGVRLSLDAVDAVRERTRGGFIEAWTGDFTANSSAPASMPSRLASLSSRPVRIMMGMCSRCGSRRIRRQVSRPSIPSPSHISRSTQA